MNACPAATLAGAVFVTEIAACAAATVAAAENSEVPSLIVVQVLSVKLVAVATILLPAETPDTVMLNAALLNVGPRQAVVPR